MNDSECTNQIKTESINTRSIFGPVRRHFTGKKKRLDSSLN